MGVDRLKWLLGILVFDRLSAEPALQSIVRRDLQTVSPSGIATGDSDRFCCLTRKRTGREFCSGSPPLGDHDRRCDPGRCRDDPRSASGRDLPGDYLCLPDHRRGHHPRHTRDRHRTPLAPLKQAIFMCLFINLVLSTVVRQDGRRKIKAPVLLVLDEFVRMDCMEQIMNIANVVAGASVEALFVTQDTGQVEKAYGPNDARSIFGSSITKRVFNLNDIETAEWAARHLGESTVYSQQIRKDKTPNQGRGFSYSEQRHKLMIAEQITAMKADDLLLLVGNWNPFKAKQNVYLKGKAYRGRFDQNPLN